MRKLKVIFKWPVVKTYQFGNGAVKVSQDEVGAVLGQTYKTTQSWMLWFKWHNKNGITSNLKL